MRFYSQRVILVLGLAAWCLVLAFVKFHALWPYQLSSWAICALCVMLGIQAEGWRKVLLLVLAVIYNPIQPIHFGDAWKTVNLLSVLAFLSLLATSSWVGPLKSLLKAVRVFGAYVFYILGSILILIALWQPIKRGEGLELILGIVGLSFGTLIFVAFLNYVWLPLMLLLDKKRKLKPKKVRPVDFTDEAFDRVFPWALGVIFLVVIGVCIALHLGISKS